MFRLFECCALSFFERFVLSFSLKIERFVSDSAEIWICGLYLRVCFRANKEIRITANGSTRSEGLSLKDVDRINDELPTEGGGPSSPDGGIVENPLG